MVHDGSRVLQNIGLTEIIIIILVLIVIFGSKRITSLAKQAGEAGKELKKIKKEYHEAVKEVNKEEINKESIKESQKGGV